MIDQDNYLAAEFHQCIGSENSIFRSFASSQDGLWFWDLDNPEYQWMSPKTWSTLGYDNPQLTGRPDAWQEIMFPEDLETGRQLLQAHLRDASQPYDHVARFRHRNGATIWLRCQGFILPPTRGTANRMLGTHQNVTRMYQKQYEAEQDLQNYLAIIDNKAIYIVKVGLDGTYTFINDFYCEDLGWKKEDVLGKEATLGIVKEDVHKCMSLYNKCIAQPGVRFQETITKQLPDGRRKVGAWEFTALKDENGQTYTILGIGQDITEKQLAEQQISYMQQALEEAGDIARIGAWSHDLRTNTTTWSRIIREIHEVPADFVPYPEKNTRFFKADHDKKLMTEAFFKCLKDGIPFDEELEIITYNGRERWVRAIGKPEFEGGQCIRVHGTLQDITPQAEAKQAIERAQQFAGQLLNNMVEGFSVIDQKGVQVQVNKAFCKMTGFSEAELLRKAPPHPYWPEEEIENIQKALNETLKEGKGAFELIFKRKDGSRFPVFLAVGTLKDPHGNITNFFANVADISQRKKAETELQRTKNILDQTSKVARVGGWEYDISSQRVSWTESVKEIHEVPLDFEPDFEKVKRFFTPESREKLLSAIDQAMADGTPYDLELQIVTARGKNVWTRGIGNAEFKHGKCIRLFGTFQDISEQKKNQEALLQAKLNAEAASVAKSEFLANMSHEIRTPLNSVIGFTDLLINTPLDDYQRDYMESVHHSAGALLDLINDILDFSKIEAGKLELAVDKTDLPQLLSQVSDIVKHKIDAQQVNFLVNEAPGLPRYIWVDPVRVKQVLINLLSNAIKFTREGEIELSVIIDSDDREEGYATILFAVKDTGIGIPANKQQKIFEAFSQEDSSITRNYGGTGLGLTISNQLLGMMGTRLSLESEPGKGSTFFFRLRVACAYQAREAPNPASRYQKALIVAKHPRQLQIMKQMLASQGIAGVTATDEPQAIQMIRHTGDFDLLVAEHHLPFSDGIQFIDHLRNHPGITSRQLPVILVYSTDDDKHIKQACSELQIQKALSHPLTTYRLREALISMQKQVEPEPVPKASEQNYAQAISLLIVDDNIMNRLVAKAMIEKAFPGSDILLAESGSEALRICREQSPQVILMDVQMPGMSGYETTEELRKMQLEPSPIIIACTAGTVKGEKERCLQAGMNDYLSKPIVLDQLKDVLERWIIAKKEESFTLQQPSDTETVTFDQAAFANSFGNNEELMKAIMAEFVRQLDDFEQDLQTHTASGQHTLLKSTCHKIRGSAGATQMKKLARLTLTLEANPDQSTGQVQQQVSEILRELDVVRDEATKFLVKN